MTTPWVRTSPSVRPIHANQSEMLQFIPKDTGASLKDPKVLFSFILIYGQKITKLWLAKRGNFFLILFSPLGSVKLRVSD